MSGPVAPGMRTLARGVVGGNVAVVCDSPGHSRSKDTGYTSQENAPPRIKVAFVWSKDNKP